MHFFPVQSRSQFCTTATFEFALFVAPYNSKCEMAGIHQNALADPKRKEKLIVEGFFGGFHFFYLIVL